MTGLTALNPLFLSLLPLALAPVIFHLFFRLRKHPRSFPTLMFFHRIDPKLNARRRLREWLILLLRTLLILFLLLALARPVWFGIGQEGSTAVALVIDNSGSMSGAGQNGRTKLEDAVDGARSLVRQLRPKDSAGLVLLVDDPAVALVPALSSDQSALKAALDQVADTEASGSIARAIERADELFEGCGAARLEIHVLSDLQAEKWTQPPVGLRPPRREASLVVHRIPSARVSGANLSLAGVELQSTSIVSGRRLPLQVHLLNPSAVEGKVSLHWLDDSGNHGSEEVVVPAGGDKTAAVMLESQNPGFRWVNLWIEGDNFAADNRASIEFVCSEKKTVLFIGSALDFGQLPLAMSPASEGRLSGLMPEFIDGSRLMVRLREQPPSLVVMTWETLAQADANSSGRRSTLSRYLDGGGNLLLVPAPTAGSLVPQPDWLTVKPGTAQTVSSGLALAVLDKANALFTDLHDAKGEVTLRNVKVFQFRPLSGPATNTPLLGLDDGRVVLTEQRIGKGRVLASGFAFDSAWSTLPLKPGFVALAQNLALASSGSATNLISLVAGSPLRLPGPQAASIRVQSLAGSPLDWKGNSLQLTTLPRSGVYALHVGAETAFAAVCSSEKEGRQQFLSRDSLPALGALPYTVRDFTGSESLLSEFLRLGKSLDLSWLFVLLALASLGLEGWLANPPPIKSARSGARYATAEPSHG